MEEKILEIISKVDKGDGYFIPHVLRKKFYADDIADNFRKFTEWFFINYKDYLTLQIDEEDLIYGYGRQDYYPKGTVEVIFIYWWNNIKDK